MIGEFEKLAEHGVTEREMTRARGQLRGAMVLGGEDSLARMGRLGRAEVVTGRLRSMGENLRRLEAVTLEEVREMAAWLVGQKRARILVGPVGCQLPTTERGRRRTATGSRRRRLVLLVRVGRVFSQRRKPKAALMS